MNGHYNIYDFAFIKWDKLVYMFNCCLVETLQGFFLTLVSVTQSLEPHVLVIFGNSHQQ